MIVVQQDPNSTLIPKDAKSNAQVVQWISFANHEILPTIGRWFRPVVGRDPYNKKTVDAAEAEIKQILKYLDQHLVDCTYIVGERMTLADLVVTAHLDRGFQYVSLWRYGKANDSCLMRSIALRTLML